jgi:hypothetical protein
MTKIKIFKDEKYVCVLEEFMCPISKKMKNN